MAVLHQSKEKLPDPSNFSKSLLLKASGDPSLLAQRVQWLTTDNGDAFIASVNQEWDNPDDFPAKLIWLTRLAQIALVYKAAKCQSAILSELCLGFEGSPKSKTFNYLNTFIEELGHGGESPDSPEKFETFRHFFSLLHPSQFELLGTPDELGRVPLHYAASLGAERICKEIISALAALPEALQQKAIASSDVYELTPLEYAVQIGHVAIVQHFLSEQCLEIVRKAPTNLDESSGILATAIRSGSVDISRQLVEKGLGVQYTTKSGKNIYHLVAEKGQSSLVDSLATQKLDINAQEDSRRRTPLIVASVHGHTEAVQALIKAGANETIQDKSGWLAKDHAAYCGHMKVVDAIKSDGSHKLPAKSRNTKLGLLPERSPNDSVVVVHFGTLDLFNPNSKTVVVEQYRHATYPLGFLDTDLDISISLGDQHKVVPLPLLVDNSDSPLCFVSDKPDEATLVFELVTSAEKKRIGTAIAILSTFQQTLGDKRDSLVRDFTIPVVNDTGSHVGTVTFTFVIGRPFEGTPATSMTTSNLEHPKFSNLGAHRGNGQNHSSFEVQIEENTLQSFQTAVDLGTDWVELDVQITEDDVPVIYHDFIVKETGLKEWMHSMTFAQFKKISDSKPYRPHGLSSSNSGLRRSLSYSDLSAVPASTVHEHGMVYEPFITLKQLLTGLPENVPLDIELKYPMHYEAVDFKLDTFAPEINHFLNIILSVVNEHAGKRQILFSTFSPEICMVYAIKGQPYPLMFLNDSSNWPTGDRRATSLQTAVRLSNRFGLNGVAMASEPFVASPGLVGFAKSQGQFTATYGPLNDQASGVEV